MKIVLSGSGSGGHFYPLIAVVEAIRKAAEEERIVALELKLLGDAPFDVEALREHEIYFEEIPAGKIRRYFSLLNIIDSFKTIRGIFRALWKFTLSPPDIVFSKGGYDSFPVLVAARIYRIPVIIHESDAVPGMVNAWAAKFARRIGVSFPEAARYFPQDKVALTGNPIRKSILGGSRDEALEMFNLETGVPTVLVSGGSQGAQPLNDVLMLALPELVQIAQVIHIAGSLHVENVKAEAGVTLEKSNYKGRYHPYGFLAPPQLRNTAFIADVMVSRAGAGSIFEVAAWRLPAIFIPLSHAAQDHQRENAYSYARTGAAEVIEEANLTPHVLISEIKKIVTDQKRRDDMKRAATSFARIDAADKIAREILHLGLHE